MQHFSRTHFDTPIQAAAVDAAAALGRQEQGDPHVASHLSHSVMIHALVGFRARMPRGCAVVGSGSKKLPCA